MGIKDLDINLLKVFVTVAEESSFTKAGQKLFLEQSAISKAIKRLESELKTELFLRTNKRVQLSSKGLILFPLAKSILEATNDFFLIAQDKEREISGTIKFGAESPISSMYMPQVLVEISRKYPDLWPMMFTGITNDILERVRKRELEFAIVFYEGQGQKELSLKKLGLCKFHVVSATNIGKEALNSFIGSREINDPNNPKLPTFEKLKKINKSLLIKYSANDLSAYKEIILKGLGIGLMPAEFIKEELKSKKIKIIHPEIKLEFPLYLIHHSSYPLSKEATSIIEELSLLLV